MTEKDKEKLREIATIVVGVGIDIQRLKTAASDATLFNQHHAEAVRKVEHIKARMKELHG